MKVIVKNKEVNLTKNEYKGQGGEGIVYCKSNIGYKIYHNPKKMIPEAKIRELSQINLPNVLAPLDVIYDTTRKPIGFTMKFLDRIEYLCKLFTRSFRDRNNISPQQVVDLVKEMQKTLIEIHKKKFLVVDYNEMNFLIDRKFAIPYHIDVDSWQTPSFRASAIMDSIRDRTTKQFTEFTDWFSWAIVTFQLYVGIHPYKGRHPKYKPRDWTTMMDDNISIFDKDVRIPANCQDLSVIPKLHLDWYKRVFQNKERSIPPFADAVLVAAAIVPRLIASTDKFAIQEVGDYASRVRRVYHFNGLNYILTSSNIYKEKTAVRSVSRDTRVELCPVVGNEPILSIQSGNEVTFEEINGTVLGKIIAEDMMFANDAIYTVHNGKLVENSFVKFKKVIHQTKTVCQIFEPAYQMLKGLVVQDILGKCWLAIPTRNICVNKHINELDGYRIIDAKHSSGICVILAEKQGRYSRFIFRFDESFDKYTVRVEDDVEIDTVNFITTPKGLCVMVVNDLKVEAFFSNDKVKVIDNPPFDSSMRLFHDGKKVLFANKEKLYSVTLT